jgi:alkanesulfonate monooxygenase SsuD/methylene tetrahydromethanopterin reductase-like flavin-dependent oxidoreductase (luciferase family)
MRFGLRLPSFALGPETASLAAMGAYLRRAEDLGFESALLIDHLLVAPPAYRTTWLEPVSLLSALAGVTRTMRLGTLVLVLPFRDPVAFAKEWATLDVLSGGRSILGVGVGWHPGEFAALRIPIKERGRRMNEMLEAITALWAGTRRSGSAAGHSRPRRSTGRRSTRSGPSSAGSRDTPRRGCRTRRRRPRWWPATGRSSARRWPGSGATRTR